MPDRARPLFALAGTGAALGLVVGVALGSRLEVGSTPSTAELRLALHAADARIELCRERSDAELAELPAHFRAKRVCEELAVDYRLTVEIDGERRLERVVAHRGVRRTRPLAVDESLSVPPGFHRVSVSFEPIPLELAHRSRPHDEGSEEHRREKATEVEIEFGADDGRIAEAFGALPAPRLETEIDFVAGRAELVTLDEDARLRIGGR